MGRSNGRRAGPDEHNRRFPRILGQNQGREAAILTLEGKKAMAAAALCGAGAVLLFRPGPLAAFVAGACLGRRGFGWLKRYWLDREA